MIGTYVYRTYIEDFRIGLFLNMFESRLLLYTSSFNRGGKIGYVRMIKGDVHIDANC